MIGSASGSDVAGGSAGRGMDPPASDLPVVGVAIGDEVAGGSAGDSGLTINLLESMDAHVCGVAIGNADAGGSAGADDVMIAVDVVPRDM